MKADVPEPALEFDDDDVFVEGVELTPPPLIKKSQSKPLSSLPKHKSDEPKSPKKACSSL